MSMPVEPQQTETSRISVAIVEDDGACRNGFSKLINRASDMHCSQGFESAETALESLNLAEIAVALIDINLPGVNGIECVRRMKARSPATQFLMVTVYEDANHIFEALAAGASGYLLKRASQKEILDAIRDVFHGGAPMSSAIARQVVQSFQATPETNDFGKLSTREQEVLEHLARGYLYKEIAEALGIGVVTVNTYVRRIYEKLHVRSRAQAVAKYLRPRGGDSGRT